MNTKELSRFDLVFPWHYIGGDDRDWAFETKHILDLIDGTFVEAVAAWSLFRPGPPPTREAVHEYWAEHLKQSRYERCLNSLYAKVFVYSLFTIVKLLEKLPGKLPVRVKGLRKEYTRHFGFLKHIRDSAIHIEDRGRGLTEHQMPVQSGIIALGAFEGNQFDFTGADGTIYGIEISEIPLEHAHRILQDIIDSYQWG